MLGITEPTPHLDNAYCAKQPMLSSFQLEGMLRHYHTLIQHEKVKPVRCISPNSLAIRWHGVHVLDTWMSAGKYLILQYPPHHYMVTCIITLLKPWWNEWEACKKNQVSASSKVENRLDISASFTGEAFELCVLELASVVEIQTFQEFKEFVFIFITMNNFPFKTLSINFP